MVIMMVGVIFTEPDVDVDADAVLMLMQNYCQEPPHTWRMSSGTSEDILHPPEVPDDDHDGWDHLH